MHECNKNIKLKLNFIDFKYYNMVFMKYDFFFKELPQPNTQNFFYLITIGMLHIYVFLEFIIKILLFVLCKINIF